MQPVGWVERSEPTALLVVQDGFRCAQPTLRASVWRATQMDSQDPSLIVRRFFIMRSPFHRIGFIWNPKLPEFLHICVERWTSANETHQTPLLSLELQDEAEVDCAIADLKAELDAAGSRAKAAIKRRRSKETSRAA